MNHNPVSLGYRETEISRLGRLTKHDQWWDGKKEVYSNVTTDDIWDNTKWEIWVNLGHRFEKSNMLYLIRFSIIDKKKQLLFGLSLNIYFALISPLFIHNATSRKEVSCIYTQTSFWLWCKICQKCILLTLVMTYHEL